MEPNEEDLKNEVVELNETIEDVDQGPQRTELEELRDLLEAVQCENNRLADDLQKAQEENKILSSERERLSKIVKIQDEQLKDVISRNDRNAVTVDALQEKLVKVVKLYNSNNSTGNN